MANIYLRHPRHGAKVAISTQEAAADMRNGWIEFDPNSTKPEAPAADTDKVVNALPARRGRPKAEPQGE